MYQHWADSSSVYIIHLEEWGKMINSCTCSAARNKICAIWLPSSCTLLSNESGKLLNCDEVQTTIWIPKLNSVYKLCVSCFDMEQLIGTDKINTDSVMDTSWSHHGLGDQDKLACCSSYSTHTHTNTLFSTNSFLGERVIVVQRGVCQAAKPFLKLELSGIISTKTSLSLQEHTLLVHYGFWRHLVACFVEAN